ncbi:MULTISPECIES: EAL domain-containing protein [unclassified Rhizobium]|uniref:bifunctional diguanylate cyclase/phosphodiesterase n=1 Tax=unclassified Rhizobium TaxID=2613769 RepID=UPI0009EA8F55|nr:MULTISPECIES: EAL domain-containing protein [unclassified Rhizobium]
MDSRNTTPRTGSTVTVACATAFFLLVGVTLTGLMMNVVTTMVASADRIDNARAERAAHSVVTALEGRLAAVTGDNSVWDDAYAASVGDDPVGWAFSNWAKTSADYPLYDGVVVTDPTGRIYSSYMKGLVFDPIAMFGPSFQKQIQAALLGGREPTVQFFAAGGKLFLIASNAIQPYAEPVGLPKPRHVLTFLKELTPAVLDAQATPYDLNGLRVATAAEHTELAIDLLSIDGNPLARLAWEEKHPGSELYHVVRPKLIVALAILLVFLIGILVSGATETRRLKALAQTARHEAAHDGLTGLLNRSGLLQEMGRVQNLRVDDGSLTLHLIDLDGFKAVNDSWGHAVGDELIKQVAYAFSNLSPAVDAVARLGGDEFALVQRGDLSTVIDEAVLAIFRTPFVIGGRTIEVGASLGTASATAIVEPLEVLRRADMALYRAKEDGRGRVVHYDPSLDVEREQLSLLEADLRLAISNGDITPVFQPLVSASDGRVRGVEALARWQAPTGNVSPETFIPLAERSGLIDALGALMLSASIIHAKRWNDLYLSVNVSPLQLCNPDFPKTVLSIVERESFDPHRLTLEITEGVLIANPDQARRAIESLKRVGVRFALDDFGCGYASIGALRTFGFDRVKIDRSLVTALGEKSNGKDVLEATVLLATALNIPVTAEGIESTDQANILRAAGCDQLQGYLHGKPMRGEDIDALLDRHLPTRPETRSGHDAVAVGKRRPARRNGIS